MDVIDGSGLRPANKTATLVAGLHCYMGASDLTAEIVVTSVGPDVSRYLSIENRFVKERVIDTRILRDLIASGSRRMIEKLIRFERSFKEAPPWLKEAARNANKILEGSLDVEIIQNIPEFVRSRQPVEVHIKVAPGTAPEAFRGVRQDDLDGDPWYAAEQYGGVVSYVDPKHGTVYDVRTDFTRLRRLRQDDRFVVLKIEEH